MSPGRALQKLLRQGPKNQKFDTKSTLKKEPVPEGVAMSELSNGTKKHTSKSRETIPLNGMRYILNFLSDAFCQKSTFQKSITLHYDKN
jgi:hypothetical protein